LQIDYFMDLHNVFAWISLLQNSVLSVWQVVGLLPQVVFLPKRVFSRSQGSWLVCCYPLKIEFRLCARGSVVWFLSLPLMNSFNKTEVALLSKQAMLSEDFPFVFSIILLKKMRYLLQSCSRILRKCIYKVFVIDIYNACAFFLF